MYRIKIVSLNETKLLQKCEDKCLSVQQWRTTDVFWLFNTDNEMHAVQKQRRQRRCGRLVLTVVSLTRSDYSDQIG